MLEHRALVDTVTAAGPGVAFSAGHRGEASEQEPSKVSSNASAPTFSQKRVRRRRSRQKTFSPGLAVWRGAQPLAARTPAQAPALLAASAPPTEPGGTGRSEEARRRCECSSHCRADEHSNRGHRNLAKRGWCTEAQSNASLDSARRLVLRNGFANSASAPNARRSRNMNLRLVARALSMRKQRRSAGARQHRQAASVGGATSSHQFPGRHRPAERRGPPARRLPQSRSLAIRMRAQAGYPSRCAWCSQC